MSIPLKARGIDLFNLVVSKASNFMLTAVLFAMVSHGTDAHGFSTFGFWWSIGIMVGGVLLGGMGSAAVRAVAVRRSVREILDTSVKLVAGIVAIGALLTVAARALRDQFSVDVVLVLAVVTFGISVMVQTVVLGLLRALEESVRNAVASILIIALVPVTALALFGPTLEPTRVFFALGAAYGVGTAVSILVAWRPLRGLLSNAEGRPYEQSRFAGDAVAFTAVNIFSYAVVNIDFTLFKLIGTSDEFAVIGSAKVFFERFVLPALMVFAGAVSLRVLRHGGDAAGPGARISARVDTLTAVGAALAVAALVAAYWIFVELVRHDSRRIPLQWIVLASIGYLFFAINAVLFDVLVVRRSLRAVFAHVAVFLLAGAAIQAIAITAFREVGWAAGWFIFNVAVTAVLASEGLRIHVGAEKLLP